MGGRVRARPFTTRAADAQLNTSVIEPGRVE